MPVSMPVLIERGNDGYLNLKTSTPGAKIYYSLNGEKYKEYTGAIELISGGKVQAYAVSENLGKSMVTSAEFPIYVDRSGWKIVSVSSENKGEEAKMQLMEIRIRSGIPVGVKMKPSIRMRSL